MVTDPLIGSVLTDTSFKGVNESVLVKRVALANDESDGNFTDPLRAIYAKTTIHFTSQIDFHESENALTSQFKGKLGARHE